MLEVRCFTCNNLVGHMWTQYMLLRQTKDGKTCLDELNLKRMCCRRMLLSHVPVTDDLIAFPNLDQVLDECGTEFTCQTHQTRTVSCD